ncbi:MAG: efflux transporter outer membrane subunit [Betaproteobacteria bacterium]
MKSIQVKTSLSLVMLALLAGCAIGPDYKRPAVELPAAYAPAPQGAAAVNTTSAASTAWWTTYNDPVLNRVVEEALKNNLDIVQAAARVAESQALLGLSISDQLPSAYATAGRSRSRLSQAVPGAGQDGIPAESTNNRVTLNLSWEIDFWGKYRRATEAARADLMSVEANRNGVKLTLVTQVVQGYFNLLALDAEVVAIQQAVRRGNDALGLQQKRFDAGVISEFDFQQRAAEVDSVLTQLPPLQSQRGKQERALAVLLGRTPRAILEDRFERLPTLTPVNAVVAPAGLPSDLLLRRPDLVEAEQKLAAANARIGVARAAYFPSISLTGLFGSESSALGDLFSGPARIWSFAGDLTQPLWGAGRVTRGVEVADARNDQAVAAYRNAVANAFREVQDAIQAQSSAREVNEIEQRRVTSLGKSWTLAKLRYDNGIANQLEVIDAERQLLLAEMNRLEAERALRAAVADLYKALGG